MAPVNRLALVPADRVIKGNSRGSQSPRRFLDFEVDGQSLYAEFYRRGFENVGVIWLDLEPESSSEVQRATSRLLGEQPGDAPGDRVSLYNCPECGDLGCGAVTVKLTVHGDRVVWSDWGWQTNYETDVDRTSLDGIPTMSFDRTEYESVLGDARQRLAVPSTRRIWSLQPLSEDADPHVAWEVLVEVLAPLATGAITDLFPDPRWDQWGGLPPEARDAHASLVKYEQGRKRKTGMAVEVPLTAEGLRLLAAWGSHSIKTELTRDDDNPVLATYDEGYIFGDVAGEEALKVQRALTQRGLPFEWRLEPRRPSLLKRLLRRT